MPPTPQVYLLRPKRHATTRHHWDLGPKVREAPIRSLDFCGTERAAAATDVFRSVQAGALYAMRHFDELDQLGWTTESETNCDEYEAIVAGEAKYIAADNRNGTFDVTYC